MLTASAPDSDDTDLPQRRAVPKTRKRYTLNDFKHRLRNESWRSRSEVRSETNTMGVERSSKECLKGSKDRLKGSKESLKGSDDLGNSREKTDSSEEMKSRSWNYRSRLDRLSRLNKGDHRSDPESDTPEAWLSDDAQTKYQRYKDRRSRMWNFTLNDRRRMRSVTDGSGMRLITDGSVGKRLSVPSATEGFRKRPSEAPSSKSDSIEAEVYLQDSLCDTEKTYFQIVQRLREIADRNKNLLKSIKKRSDDALDGSASEKDFLHMNDGQSFLKDSGRRRTGGKKVDRNDDTMEGEVKHSKPCTCVMNTHVNKAEAHGTQKSPMKTKASREEGSRWTRALYRGRYVEPGFPSIGKCFEKTAEKDSTINATVKARDRFGWFRSNPSTFCVSECSKTRTCTTYGRTSNHSRLSCDSLLSGRSRRRAGRSLGTEDTKSRQSSWRDVLKNLTAREASIDDMDSAREETLPPPPRRSKWGFSRAMLNGKERVLRKTNQEGGKLARKAKGGKVCESFDRPKAEDALDKDKNRVTRRRLVSKRKLEAPRVYFKEHPRYVPADYCEPEPKPYKKKFRITIKKKNKSRGRHACTCQERWETRRHEQACHKPARPGGHRHGQTDARMPKVDSGQADARVRKVDAKPDGCRTGPPSGRSRPSITTEPVQSLRLDSKQASSHYESRKAPNNEDRRPCNLCPPRQPSPSDLRQFLPVRSRESSLPSESQQIPPGLSVLDGSEISTQLQTRYDTILNSGPRTDSPKYGTRGEPQHGTQPFEATLSGKESSGMKLSPERETLPQCTPEPRLFSPKSADAEPSTREQSEPFWPRPSPNNLVRDPSTREQSEPFNWPRPSPNNLVKGSIDNTRETINTKAVDTDSPGDQPTTTSDTGEDVQHDHSQRTSFLSTPSQHDHSQRTSFLSTPSNSIKRVHFKESLNSCFYYNLSDNSTDTLNSRKGKKGSPVNDKGLRSNREKTQLDGQAFRPSDNGPTENLFNLEKLFLPPPKAFKPTDSMEWAFSLGEMLPGGKGSQTKDSLDKRVNPFNSNTGEEKNDKFMDCPVRTQMFAHSPDHRRPEDFDFQEVELSSNVYDDVERPVVHGRPFDANGQPLVTKHSVANCDQLSVNKNNLPAVNGVSADSKEPSQLPPSAKAVSFHSPKLAGPKDSLKLAGRGFQDGRNLEAVKESKMGGRGVKDGRDLETAKDLERGHVGGLGGVNLSGNGEGRDQSAQETRKLSVLKTTTNELNALNPAGLPGTIFVCGARSSAGTGMESRSPATLEVGKKALPTVLNPAGPLGTIFVCGARSSAGATGMESRSPPNLEVGKAPVPPTGRKGRRTPPSLCITCDMCPHCTHTPTSGSKNLRIEVNLAPLCNLLNRVKTGLVYVRYLGCKTFLQMSAVGEKVSVQDENVK
ncbi:hypothetical protein M8J76_005017 [Diaphorina citri]|nr:hypothetical protein M8J76_005017 [Diaphorina citri]